MPRAESGNHEEAAFSADPPASSRNPTTDGRRGSDLTYACWALCLILWSWLHATLLVDAAAFERVARLFDDPVTIWAEFTLGDLGVLYVAIGMRRTAAEPTRARAQTVLSMLAILGYGFHVYVLRWPWLTGAADVGSRRDLWSAILSTTFRGVPLLAFVELLSLLAIAVQGYLGLELSRPYARLRSASPRFHRLTVATALISYALVCSLVVALATGRR